MTREFIVDLLLLEGNPLEDLRHLQNPLLVMKEGKIVVDRRMAPVGIVDDVM